MLTGIGAGLMGGLLPLNVLGELVSSGTLLAFVTVCIGIMVLRVTKPELPRPFRVKWVWFVGIGGTLFCGLMLISLFMTGGTWYRIVGWTILGLHRVLRLRLQAQHAAQLGEQRADRSREPANHEVARAASTDAAEDPAMNKVWIVMYGVTITPWKLVGYGGVLMFAGRWFVQLAARGRTARSSCRGCSGT